MEGQNNLPPEALAILREMNLTMTNTMNGLRQEFQTLQTQHHGLQEQYTNAQAEIAQLREPIAEERNTKSRSFVKKPNDFSGKSNECVESFIGNVDLYLEQVPSNQQVNVAVSYLTEDAFNWYQTMKQNGNVNSWDQLKDELKMRFNQINTKKAPRDRLAVCAQTGSVSAYNAEIQRIIMDIPSISDDEIIDRYTRGLKKYIYIHLCTNTNTELNEVMGDAEKIEFAKGGTHEESTPQRYTPRSHNGMQGGGGPAPMDISNTDMRAKQRQNDVKTTLVSTAIRQVVDEYHARYGKKTCRDN